MPTIWSFRSKRVLYMSEDLNRQCFFRKHLILNLLAWKGRMLVNERFSAMAISVDRRSLRAVVVQAR